MKGAELGAKWLLSCGSISQAVVPATGLPSASVQSKAAPPQAWTSIPRCRLYQACRAGASLALKKMPPMPMTRFMGPPLRGEGERADSWTGGFDFKQLGHRCQVIRSMDGEPDATAFGVRSCFEKQLLDLVGKRAGHGELECALAENDCYPDRTLVRGEIEQGSLLVLEQAHLAEVGFRRLPSHRERAIGGFNLADDPIPDRQRRTHDALELSH